MKKLKDISKEELELMSYDDLAYLVLKEKNKKMKINDLFKQICEVLQLSEEEYEDKIADFFEILTTDKRFILLANGFWDLKDKHSEKVIIEEDEEEEEEYEEIIDEEPEIIEDNYDDETDDDDKDDDDIKDLVIIDDEDENEL